MGKTNRDLLEDLGIELRGVRDVGKVKCPKCSHTRKKKNEPCLNVNITDGTYKCWNPGCEFKGSVAKRDEPEKPAKNYNVPKFNNRTELPQGVVSWFGKRSINQDVLIRNKITYGPEWMPQVFYFHVDRLTKEGFAGDITAEAHKLARVPTIQFNYFRRGQLVNVKYRDTNKNFRMVKDAELIFYGYDDVVDSDWCVIVEGEPDKLAFAEAGIHQVISVPNGAVKSDNPDDLKLDYLDNCIELFTNKTKIIIATDDDEPGRFLGEELARRLGKDRCFKVNMLGHKDANDCLKFSGPEALAAVVSDDNLIEYPIEGIFTLDMFEDDIDDIIKNGLPKGETVDLRPLDKIFTWLLGYFIVVTGIPNHGKSPFCLQIACRLAVNKGWKIGIFTPEHRKAAIYFIKIIKFLTGKDAKNLTPEELTTAKTFVKKHFFIVNPKDYSVDNVLDKGRILVLKYGIRMLIADPWNKFEHNRPTHLSETEYVSRELDKFTAFAESNNCLTMLVAHPTKMKKDKNGLHEVPSLYDISSSAHFYNKPDGGLTIYRNYASKLTNIHIQKVKDDHIGTIGCADLEYNPANGRLGLPGQFDYTNWLRPKEEQMEIQIEDPNTVPVEDFTLNERIDDSMDIPF